MSGFPSPAIAACADRGEGRSAKPQASCAMGVRDLRPGPNGSRRKFSPTPDGQEGPRRRDGIPADSTNPLDLPDLRPGRRCDLQDQAMAFGSIPRAITENKRGGRRQVYRPAVKTVMNRCITARAASASPRGRRISELGLIGRGEDAEITTYLESAMTSSCRAMSSISARPPLTSSPSPSRRGRGS